MRVVLEDQPIFAGAGLALVTIAQNVFWLWSGLGNKRPLQPRAESRTAASAQARIFHQIDDVIRRHGQRLLHRFVAVQLQIAVDTGRTFAKAFGDDLDLVGMKLSRPFPKLSVCTLPKSC